jgi:hypothetical protein
MPKFGESVRELDLGDPPPPEPEVIRAPIEAPDTNIFVHVDEITVAHRTWGMDEQRIRMTVTPEGGKVYRPGEYMKIYSGGKNIQILITDVVMNMPEVRLRERDGSSRFVPGRPNVELEGVVVP